MSKATCSECGQVYGRHFSGCPEDTGEEPEAAQIEPDENKALYKNTDDE